jgi:hypothetical protein
MATEEEKKEIMAAMDAAGVIAEKELPTLKTAKDVYAWWGKHYTKAGHKRLGRALVRASK